MQLTEQQEAGFKQIYLRVLMQLAIETMEELKDTPAYKGKLKVKMNDLYQALDKNTREYDDLYNATAEGTTSFYKVVHKNTEAILHFNLPELNIINNMILAFELNEKAVMGIVNKVLKAPIKK